MCLPTSVSSPHTLSFGQIQVWSCYLIIPSLGRFKNGTALITFNCLNDLFHIKDVTVRVLLPVSKQYCDILSDRRGEK